MEPRTVNCAEDCVNGCVLGEACPHREHLAATSKFIQDTSIEQILEIAEESVRKKFAQSAEHYLPDLPAWSE